MDHQTGDVVFGSTLLGCIDNDLGRFLGIIVVLQKLGQLIVLYAIGHAVRAEEITITACRDNFPGFSIDPAFFSAQITVQHILVAMVLCLFRRDCAGID